MPTKFKTWYEKIGEKEGTTFKLPSRTNQDSEKEVNIYAMIEKYGVTAIMKKTKPEEELYIDCEMFEERDANKIIENHRRIEDYYKQLPSVVRKEFGDDFDRFYEDLRLGKYEKFINQGILSDETVENVKKYYQQKEKDYQNQIIEKYKQEEYLKQQAIEQLKNGEQK